MTDREVYRKLAELVKCGTPVCLATIVETEGSTPREVGAKMLVCVDGSQHGTVGGGCGENTVRSAAFRCLLSTRNPELVEVQLRDELEMRETDVCGGMMRVFVQPFQ